MITNYSIESLFRNETTFPFVIEEAFLNLDFPIHTHEFSELVMVINGTALHVIDNEEYSISSGDVYVLQGNTVHGFKNVNNLRIVNIMYDYKKLLYVEENLKQMPGFQALFLLEPIYRKEYGFKSKLKLDFSNQQLVLSIIRTMLHEFQNRKEGYDSILRAYLNQLIVQLSRVYKEKMVNVQDNLFKFAELAAFIEQNYNKNLTVSELSQRLGFSERHFSRIFTSVYGTSPIEYVMKLRLDHSRELLKNKKLNITDVAIHCGFEDSNYFTRQFKKYYGITPSQFKKSSTSTERYMI
jgi:AraC-like DNA-binding protein